MKAQLLVVDDESEIREMLSRHFRLAGYDVTTASNGVEALAYLRSNKVHVVITDIRMPKMDGVELARLIQKQHPLVRTVAISGYVSLSSAMACMRYGVDALIPKPIEDVDRLESVVRRATTIIGEWTEQLRELTAMKGTAGGRSK